MQVVIKAYMNYAASWNRILDSEGWGIAGLFVKDNKYTPRTRNPIGEYFRYPKPYQVDSND
jgi:hypothetical protein